MYDAIEAVGKRNAIAYVHFRNVKGSVHNYNEVFVDEGDVDMVGCPLLLVTTATALILILLLLPP